MSAPCIVLLLASICAAAAAAGTAADVPSAKLHALQPRSPAELLFFSTVRLEANGANGTAVGTGFFFFFEDAPEQILIVTNKHVLDGATSVECLLHEGDGNAPLATQKRIRWTPPPAGLSGARIDHPTPEVDLAALPFTEPSGRRTAAAWQVISNPNPQHGVFLRAASSEQILSDAQLVESLNGVEQVLVYGYPNGLWDVANSLPIARTGLTASAPSLDYAPPRDVSVSPHSNGTSGGPSAAPPGAIGLLDVACYPGSSGSPVVYVDVGPAYDRWGNLKVGGPRRLFLLGVIFGNIRHVNGLAMTVRVPTLPDLGITIPYEEDLRLSLYWKAREILAMRPLLLS